jgi:hypothetical protein
MHGARLRCILLPLQLLFAPSPRLNLKLASSAALPRHFPDDLADECEPHPCASTAALSQPGPTWALDGVTRIPFLLPLDNSDLS